jgi:hypothetical protein
VGKRIILLDEYHRDEPIEAEVERSSPTELILTIPNTEGRFKLRRHDPESPFKGSLGGRDFVLDPRKSGIAD